MKLTIFVTPVLSKIGYFHNFRSHKRVKHAFRRADVGEIIYECDKSREPFRSCWRQEVLTQDACRLE